MRLAMQALKYHSVVKKNGTIEIPKLPFTEGQRVEIIILPENAPHHELTEASESSLKFWDNPTDDEVWNAVSTSGYRSNSSSLHRFCSARKKGR
jgi:hypothetical protein